ncbi:hypothetical protein BKA15_003444 [Microlunatus parietis]|uniref:Uncharacterized protein n=1 Tax=Microlunatus parietis TaxID=682979 RepID=A0A7Y9I8M8_9ACTN|nr:hypothetical protein [Microlunatus parietis]
MLDYVIEVVATVLVIAALIISCAALSSPRRPPGPRR